MPPMSCSSISTAMTESDIDFFVTAFCGVFDEDEDLRDLG